MNVSVTRNKTSVTSMYNMKHGDIGVVVGPMYAGDVVKAYVFNGKITVFSLSDANHLWESSHHGKNGGVQVDILPSGSEVHISVP